MSYSHTVARLVNVLLLTSGSWFVASVVSGDVPDFSTDVAPIMQKYCVGCHSGDEAEADLLLDSYQGLMRGGENGASVRPKDVDRSTLISRMTGRVLPMMPPEDEPQPTNTELGLLIRWVQAGATGPAEGDEADTRFKIPKLPPSSAGRPVTAVALSPGGDMLAVAQFGQVELRNAERDGKLQHRFETPGKVNSLKFAVDGKLLVASTGIAGLRGDAMIWDTTSGNRVYDLSGHSDTIYDAAMSHDGRLLATAGYDRKIILWDLATGEQLRTLSGHNGAVYDVCFSPDDKVLASASADTTVKIWQVSTGRRLDTLSQPLQEQYSVDISADGRFIVAAGEDNRIRLWQLVSVDQQAINPLRFARFAHDSAIQQVRFTSDGKQVVSVAVDNSVKVWEADEMRQSQTFEGLENSSHTIAVAGSRIATGRLDGRVHFLELKAESTASAEQPGIQEIVATSVERAAEDVAEAEPNNSPANANRITLPAVVTGTIWDRKAESDEDLFRFAARAGETWIFEIKAERNESPLDSHLAILHADGRPVQRVQLHAVRDSYFTFRGKDSNTNGDFRLHNWEEMKLNQLLYASGEVVKLYHYPRGPDSGFNVYPNFGKRRGYFDTTPIAHALHAPCYIVEPHPPGVELPPNGLPVFTLHFENDDDAWRRLGRDSRLTFVAPTDGDYLVRVRDVRGFHGDQFRYELSVDVPRPDFSFKLADRDPKVAPGTGKKIGFVVERIDHFDGPVNIEFENLPTGFSVPGPLQVEAGQDRAWATLLAEEGAETPSEQANGKVRIVATAMIGGKSVQRTVDSLGKIEVAEPTKVFVDLTPDGEPIESAGDLPVIELHAGETTTATIHITRQEFDGRVGFGQQDAAVNSPHGVYVDNTGLNGLLIVEGEDRRSFFITAEPWVESQERLIFVEADAPGRPTSKPVILRIIGSMPKVADQASNVGIR